MFVCKIKNSKNDTLTLTQNESDFQVINIEGLNPPNAHINTTNIAGLDGERFNSAKLESREIVIYLKLNNDVEENRIMLYNYFPTKEFCTFYYTNDHRDVFIEGYVQSVEVSPFSDSEVMQISILCPKTFFNDIEEIITEVSNVLSAFTFPFSISSASPIPFSTIILDADINIRNDSETDSGMTIVINVRNNINKILIRNLTTGEYFGISSIYGFNANDLITINTTHGEKSITLLRNGTITNLFSKIISGSKFIQLTKGDNSLGYLVDDTVGRENYVEVEFKHRNIYRGV